MENAVAKAANRTSREMADVPEQDSADVPNLSKMRVVAATRQWSREYTAASLGFAAGIAAGVGLAVGLWLGCNRK